jgi:5-methylcytosine-specific restriction endonuclease McrA
MINCLQCGVQVISKYAEKFCTQSCAAKYNNVKFPKRSLIKKYCSCGKVVRKSTLQCAECRNKDRASQALSYTVGYLKSLYGVNLLKLAAKIRGYSKYVYKRSGQPRVCFNCGYSKHIEVCHIKAVSDFSDDATMAEVHQLSNLIALCPNCHWEFDNKLLTIVK